MGRTRLVGALAVGLAVTGACGSEETPAVESGGDSGVATAADASGTPFQPPADAAAETSASSDASDASDATGPNPNVNVAGCSGTQVKCGGVCVSTSVDPKNCGACGNVCTPGQVCYSSGCAGTCPGGLSACQQSCVDTSSDNKHCGACGTACAAGQGCVGGSCVAGVAVGPAPAKCAGGGPPIVVQGGAAPQCTGNLAQVSFTHALCACGDIGVPALSSDTLVDAFDSKAGPYAPNGLGGSIGANGQLRMTSKLTASGDIRISGAGGLTVGGETSAAQDLHVKGPVVLSQTLAVGGAATVGGSISGSSQANIAGKLTTPTCGSVPGNVHAASCTSASPTVTDPCACKPSQLVPVSALVSHYAIPANNDNALIGLSAATFDAPGAPARLDLPCGYYYLNRITSTGALTIAVHGPTALFVGGSIQVGSAITFALDPGATLDVFVGGTVVASALLKVGSRAYPAGSRFYVGGVCKGSGLACSLNADCCSNSCTGGSCAGAGVTPPFSVNLTSNSDLNGLFYSANAGFRTSSDLEMFGAVFSGYYHSSSNTKLHYDRAATTLADECPGPGPGPSTGDGGPTPLADGGGGGTADAGGGGGGCASCRDCGNQACNGGTCGACVTSADCCSPLSCVGGVCGFRIN